MCGLYSIPVACMLNSHTYRRLELSGENCAMCVCVAVLTPTSSNPSIVVLYRAKIPGSMTGGRVPPNLCITWARTILHIGLGLCST